jgi:hypothetical protein
MSTYSLENASISIIDELFQLLEEQPAKIDPPVRHLHAVEKDGVS